jgi:hypothetical protein
MVSTLHRSYRNLQVFYFYSKINFSSEGVIYDWAASETIGKDELAFGEPHKQSIKTLKIVVKFKYVFKNLTTFVILA